MLVSHWQELAVLTPCGQLPEGRVSLGGGEAAQAAGGPWDRQNLPGLQACPGRDRSSPSFTAWSSPVVLLDV